jgi:hypothetical protein
MAQPKTLAGFRDAGARGKVDDRRGLPEIPEHVRDPREGEGVYVSPNEGMRMTLWVNWENVTYSITGKRLPERRDIQFRGGVYRTTDEREIKALNASKSKGVTFFDLAELRGMARDAKIARAKEVLEDPEVQEALHLSQDKTVTMPPRGKKKPAESEEGAAPAAS